MANTSKLIWVFLVVLLAACSPKIQKPNHLPQPNTNDNTKVVSFTEANISLLIPFKLNQINLKTATKAQVNKANMAIDFYQGVKLGIDSASLLGLNFKLNVFDTRDDHAQLNILLKKENLMSSNLIIGPVFPEGIKKIKNFSIANDLPVVSPLAATKPSEFAHPKLISIVNNIDQHGAKIADYIANNYHANQTIVVLISTKKTADEQFAQPIRNQFKQKYPSFLVQEYTSTYAFETKMMKEKKYAIIICASDVSFVKPSIDKLYKLKNLKNGGFEINLFGHPNWIKQNYDAQQLQDLNTILSSSYQVNYKSKDVINFVKKYRNKFNFEPSEYAFKGFDIGFYFGKLLTKYGLNYLDYLTKEKYQGLHNSFSFSYNPLYGYYNTDLMILQYKNFNLNKID